VTCDVIDQGLVPCIVAVAAAFRYWVVGTNLSLLCTFELVFVTLLQCELPLYMYTTMLLQLLLTYRIEHHRARVSIHVLMCHTLASSSWEQCQCFSYPLKITWLRVEAWRGLLSTMAKINGRISIGPHTSSFVSRYKFDTGLSAFHFVILR